MKIFILLFCIVGFLFSCEKSDDTIQFDKTNYSDYISFDSILTGIDFYPMEVYGIYSVNDTPSLKIEFNTTEYYTCYERVIAVSRFDTANELIIRFDSIRAFCAFAMPGPGSISIDLHEDVKQLILINGQSIDAYRIMISNEKVEITEVVSSFSELRYNILFRYPENSFAYICETSYETKYFFDDFLELLTSTISLTEFKFEGEGIIPYPDSAYGYSNVNPVKYFIYNNERDFDQAGDLLISYAGENISPEDAVRIKLINWKNKQYVSW